MSEYRRNRFEGILEKFIQSELRGAFVRGSGTPEEYELFSGFPQMTNHEICHEMFWNSIRGFSKTYIEMPNLEFYTPEFSEEGYTTLTFSLLSKQMLHYDQTLFGMMHDWQNPSDREKALAFYRPYLFGYVATVSRTEYNALCKLQQEVRAYLEKKDKGDQEETDPKCQAYMDSYVWVPCSFVQNSSSENSMVLQGYVIESASNITKTKLPLVVLKKNNKLPRRAEVRKIWEVYSGLPNAIISDTDWVDKISKHLDNNRLKQADIYKVGNGNCIFMQTESDSVGFFYDIGYNYGHLRKDIKVKVSYNYTATMAEVAAKKPSFVLLSHWDMDHIAGHYHMKKSKVFDIDWFAPDCNDAHVDAKRVATYLYLKDHLFLVTRKTGTGSSPARRIGDPIDIKDDTGNLLATYKLYMGEKHSCDSNAKNCEGIVMEYRDEIRKETVLMMGDVNYASFNAARLAASESLFADMPITYLVAPHHGSRHTDYTSITDPKKSPIKGEKAVFCCNNVPEADRPNDQHRMELQKRFDQNVVTTEEAKLPDVSVTFKLLPKK